MNFVLQTWFTVVFIFCQSYPNLSAPPNFFPTSGVLPQFKMSSDATATSLVRLTSDDFTHQGKNSRLERLMEIWINPIPCSNPLLGWRPWVDCMLCQRLFMTSFRFWVPVRWIQVHQLNCTWPPSDLFIFGFVFSTFVYFQNIHVSSFGFFIPL